jgi:anti-sigma factor RsiW
METCAESSALIQPYLDGELTEGDPQRLLSHVKTCAGCRQEMEELKALSSRLRQVRPLVTAPESLKQRIAKLAAASEEFGTETEETRPNVLQITSKSAIRARWMPALIAAALCIASGISFWGVNHRRQAADSSFVEAAIATHHGLMKNASMPLDIRSDSPKVVSAWFSDRVSFNFRMPNASIASDDRARYKLIGGRLVNFAGEPAALLVFQINGESVSVLVASGKKANARGGVVTDSNGIRFHAVDRENLHVVTWENVHLVYALIFSNKISQNGGCAACHQDNSPAMTARLHTVY